jgi:hypothetical protein
MAVFYVTGLRLVGFTLFCRCGLDHGLLGVRALSGQWAIFYCWLTPGRCGDAISLPMTGILLVGKPVFGIGQLLEGFFFFSFANWWDRIGQSGSGHFALPSEGQVFDFGLLLALPASAAIVVSACGICRQLQRQ